MAEERLDARARDLIRVHIIAGDSDREVRVALKEAGYCDGIRSATLARFRNEPEIVAAVQKHRAEVVQEGFAAYHRRVETLAMLAENLERKLVDDFFDEDDDLIREDRLLPLPESLALTEQFMAVLQEISRLVDGPDPSEHCRRILREERSASDGGSHDQMEKPGVRVVLDALDRVNPEGAQALRERMRKRAQAAEESAREQL